MSRIFKFPGKKNTVAVVVLAVTLFACQAVFATSSLRFYGMPTNDDHRVKIRVDDPGNSDPGPPADIGSEDFTLEFWLKAASGNDATASAPCEAGWYSWIFGNIIIDRDRFNQGSGFGISIIDGVLWFGLDNQTNVAHTICGSTNVLDSQWHHVVVQRRISDGWIQLFVDGNLEAEADGPDGDISYPDDGIPGNFCSGTCDFSDPFLVIGAEKHDADLAAYPSYSGYIDELRLSNTIRYPGSTYTVPSQAFVADNNTVALYHLDEGSGTVVNDTSGAAGGPSHGEIRPGVDWTMDTPFSGATSPVPGSIQFTEALLQANESTVSQTLTVTRSGGDGIVTVDYLVGDTGSSATSGADYESIAQQATGTLTWQDGDTGSQSLTVNILNDVEVENDESVVITLSNPTGGASLGANASAVLSILDDDSAGTIQFLNDSQTVNEGDASVTITVVRTNGNSGMADVDFAVSGGLAEIDEDYQAIQPASGKLTFQNGQTTADITLNVVDDSLPEPVESVSFSLSNVSQATLGERETFVLSIIDNDSETTNKPESKKSGGVIHPLLVVLFLLLMLHRRIRGPQTRNSQNA